MTDYEWFKKRQDLAVQVRDELLGDIESYIDLQEDSVQLDDWYTAEQLRRIVNALEEYQKRLKILESKK